MLHINVLIATLVITVYVPLAGGINGSGGVTRSGIKPQTGLAGCGYEYPFGTVFEILDEDMSQYGLPQVVICEDRGWASRYNAIDIALVSPDVRGDLTRAFTWGRRLRHARIYTSMLMYHRAHHMVPNWHGPW